MHVVRVISEYKGFTIKLIGTGAYYNAYYGIYEGEWQASILCLNSEKACKNVIDTHERALSDKLKYEIA